MKRSEIPEKKKIKNPEKKKRRKSFLSPQLLWKKNKNPPLSPLYEAVKKLGSLSWQGWCWRLGFFGMRGFGKALGLFLKVSGVGKGKTRSREIFLLDGAWELLETPWNDVSCGTENSRMKVFFGNGQSQGFPFYLRCLNP